MHAVSICHSQVPKDSHLRLQPGIFRFELLHALFERMMIGLRIGPSGARGFTPDISTHLSRWQANPQRG